MAKYFLTRTVAPVVEAVTVADVKANARIDYADEDALIQTYITAAIRSVEEMSGRAMNAQTWELKTYGLTGNVTQPLPYAPVQSLTSITYKDKDNATQTMDVANFFLFKDDYKAFVEPKDGTQWPSTYDRPDAIAITYVAGYADAASVPVGLKQAVILLCTHWFEHRQPVSDNRMMEVPYAVEHLVNLDKTGWIAA